MKSRNVLLTFAAVLWLASAAHAQSEIAPSIGVSFVGGLASTQSITGIVLGGSIVFAVHDYVALEGRRRAGGGDPSKPCALSSRFGR